MEKTLAYFHIFYLADLKGFLNLCKFIFQVSGIFIGKKKKNEERTGSALLLSLI
jgi:hypothetical protein